MKRLGHRDEEKEKLWKKGAGRGICIHAENIVHLHQREQREYNRRIVEKRERERDGKHWSYRACRVQFREENRNIQVFFSQDWEERFPS